MRISEMTELFVHNVRSQVSFKFSQNVKNFIIFCLNAQKFHRLYLNLILLRSSNAPFLVFLNSSTRVCWV